VVQERYEPPHPLGAPRARLTTTPALRPSFAISGRLLRGASSVVLRLLLVLVVIEGTASWIGFGIALPDGGRPPERERLHMQYDPELGWAHVPDTHLEDFYGPGRHLTINAQGFRGKRSYTPDTPEGRLRAICAGDQFTLGTGVGDDDTWCARLESLEPRFETLNLGQGGYGLDQSYLWYRRDGMAFETDLVVFAFVRDEFTRMESPTYRQYAKPLLRLEDDGDLAVRNVPVPHPGERVPWLVRNAPLFDQLRIVQLARPALEALGPTSVSQLTVGELSDLSGGVFEALQRTSDQQGATLVLLYLPTRGEYDAPGDLWRRRIAREARRRGIPFLDLVEDQKRMGRREMTELYVPVTSPSADGEPEPFSEAGNAWVAESLWRHLQRIPELAALLATQTPS
jgi:hypothetical protein